MTISVFTLVPEGIAFASDTRQTRVDSCGNFKIDSDLAPKIIELSPFTAAVINGRSFFYPNESESPRHLFSILRSVKGKIKSNTSIKEIADIIFQEVTANLSKEPSVNHLDQGSISIYLVGYCNHSETGEMYCIDSKEGISIVRKTSDAGLVWKGQTVFVDRLIKGFDPALLKILELTDREKKDAVVEELFKLQLHLNFQTMPVEEALNLATGLVQATILFSNLANGIVGSPSGYATCGGRVESATITPEFGFAWSSARGLSDSDKRDSEKGG